MYIFYFIYIANCNNTGFQAFKLFVNDIKPIGTMQYFKLLFKADKKKSLTYVSTTVFFICINNYVNCQQWSILYIARLL